MCVTKLLKELIKNELWGEQLSFSSIDKKDFSALQNIVNMQTVNGLVYSSLINNNVKLPQQEAFVAFGSLENTKKANLLSITMKNFLKPSSSGIKNIICLNYLFDP